MAELVGQHTAAPMRSICRGECRQRLTPSSKTANQCKVRQTAIKIGFSDKNRLGLKRGRVKMGIFMIEAGFKPAPTWPLIRIRAATMQGGPYFVESL